VVYDLARASYGTWIAEESGAFVGLSLSGTNLDGISDDTINGKYLDKTIYFLADAYKTIAPIHFERID
jgi:hypothetical protein